MPTDVVLDTHALVWWADESPQLSAPARAVIAGASAVVVSAISFWEIGMLIEKGRLRLDRSFERWQLAVLAQPSVLELPVRADIARTAAELSGFHGDPADRIIVASALTTQRHLISRDARIADWASSNDLTCVW